MPEAHWTERLVLEHPEVFLRIHEHGWEAGEAVSGDRRKLVAVARPAAHG